MNSEIREDLERLVSTRRPLSDVLIRLRELKDSGVARSDVQETLEAMRRDAPDEPSEDYILEVLDFVSGFCSAENTIWAEPDRVG